MEKIIQQIKDELRLNGESKQRTVHLDAAAAHLRHAIEQLHEFNTRMIDHAKVIQAEASPNRK
jgi:hypothetical protein